MKTDRTSERKKIPQEEALILETLTQEESARVLNDHQKLLILYGVMNSLGSYLDLDKLLEELMSVLFGLVPADHGFIFLLDEPSTHASLVLKRSRYPKDGKIDQFVSHTVLGHVLKHQKPVLSMDATQDERFTGSQSIQMGPIRSILCVPLINKKSILGAVQLESALSHGAFTKEDLMLVGAIANQAAIAIENARLHTRLQRENQSLRQTLGKSEQFVGKSSAVREILGLTERLSSTDSTVLIRGESGTGKEIIARLLHYAGSRKNRPFVSLNCANLSETLLESELFGHEKGAFTDARERKIGRFEQAEDGTIFLDEIGEMASNTQAKLLRVLQEREFQRVGGNQTIHTKARIVASTNKNLEEAIQKGTFREDLYYRLKVIELRLPALRERREDIPLLLDFFIRQFAQELGRPLPKISAEALGLLLSYNWPGNVRELKNSVERAMVLATGNEIDPAHLPIDLLRPTNTVSSTEGPASSVSLDGIEREHILKTLESCGWNKKRTASLLGISRPRLDRKIETFQLKRYPSA
ncbi:MAG: sigma-54-dependent Fis family transcriptional regulator [Candidatus Omnitrophica bacterium]|nr:sigma-54-dependent Fis family transcriptional regulator [Candidatus Omnitrophota bacterium]